LFLSIREHPELESLNILVDSNGNVDQQKWDPIINLVDGFMLDVKAYSPEIHRKITGHSNDKILNSIQYLNDKGKLKELRLVFVPGYNDDEVEINKIASLMKSVSSDVRKVLIKMRKHGIRKSYDFLSEPTETEMVNTRKRIEELGVLVDLV